MLCLGAIYIVPKKDPAISAKTIVPMYKTRSQLRSINKPSPV